MRTLVTGGAGFIGSHLVQRLVDAGDDVVVLDSLEPQVHEGTTPDLPGNVEFVHGDVGDAAVAARALEGVDRVAHLAAGVGVGQSMYEVERYVRMNSLATASFLQCVIESPERPSRLVVASSMSIYGEGEYSCRDHGRVAPGPRPESQLLERHWEVKCPTCGLDLTPLPTSESKPLIPTSVYAVTKRDHEELCLVLGAAYDIPTLALRFFNVYGPGQAVSNPYTGVAAIFAARLLNGNRPMVFEDGMQSRDFIHVSDIVDGILLALGPDAPSGEAVNLGTGRPVTVAEIASVLATSLASDVEAEVVEKYRSGDIRHCYADTARAQELLGFTAKMTLEAGMRDLADWLSRQDAIDRVDAATRELTVRGLAR